MVFRRYVKVLLLVRFLKMVMGRADSFRRSYLGQAYGNGTVGDKKTGKKKKILRITRHFLELVRSDSILGAQNLVDPKSTMK